MHPLPGIFYVYDLSFWTTDLDFLYLCFWPLPAPWMLQLKDLISEYWIKHVTMEFLVSKLYSHLGSQIAKFMGPIWGPPGSCRPQMGSILAPWTLLSGNSPVVFQALQLITLEVFRAMHWPLASRMLVYWVLNNICSVSGIEWIFFVIIAASVCTYIVTYILIVYRGV